MTEHYILYYNMFLKISLFIGNARIENSELNMLLKSEVIVLIF